MSRAVVLAVLALLGALVLLPVLRFLLLPVLPGLAPAYAPPTGPLPGLGAAALVSVLVATASGLLAAVPAATLGFLLEHRDWIGRRLCAGACWAALLLPGYLLVAGWEIVLDAGAATASPGWGYGPAADWLLLVAAMAAKGLPLAVLAARIGWSVLPPALEDAARVNLRGTTRRIRMRLAAFAPMALLAFLLCFDQAMDEYGIASVLGQRLTLRLLAAEVSADLLQWPVSWPRAATCADLLVATALMPFLLRWRSWYGAAEPGPAGPEPRRAAGAGTCALAWGLFALLAVPGLLVPMAALASDLRAGPSSWSLSPEGARGLLWSASYGLVAATTATALAAVLAATADGAGRALLFRALPLFTLSIPGIVLGAAFVIGYGDAPVPVLGTPLALLLADVATTLPIGLLALRAAMGRRMRLGGDAARVHGMNRMARIERVHAPPLLSPLAGAWCLCFCRLFFELPLAQMLAPAGREPVGIVLLGLGESLRLGDEAVLAFAGLAVCGTVVLTVTLAAALLTGRT